MDKASELGKSLLFKELPTSELKKLADIAQQHSLNAGDRLFAQGEESGELYIIVLGSMKIIRRLDSGGEEQIAIFGSGSYTGEAALFGNEARAISAYALEKTFVLGINPQALDEICTTDPVLGMHVYRAIATALAHRCRGFVGQAAYYKALSLHH